MNIEANNGPREELIKRMTVIHGGKYGGQPGGPVLIADFYPETKILCTEWNTDSDPEEFKLKARERCNGIDWEGLIGTTPEFSISLNSSSKRAEIRLDMSKIISTNAFLKRILAITSATMMERAYLPDNLAEDLKNFIDLKRK
jgi:hypothetical protein